MRARDILILLGLIVLILVLTVAEKYAQRTREDRREEELARSLATKQEAALKSFHDRWNDLSAEVKQTLDSMAADIVQSGVPEESLAVMVVESTPETVYVQVPAETTPSAGGVEPDSPPIETPAPAEEDSNELAASASGADNEDSLARQVAAEYHEALRALPKDLNAYEQRVATNEIASLIRTRHNLAIDRFDNLLKRAASLERGGQ